MGDPLGGHTLTTKLMIENRQSSGEFIAGLASLSALGSRGADRTARAAHADRMRQWSAESGPSTSGRTSLTNGTLDHLDESCKRAG